MKKEKNTKEKNTKEELKDNKEAEIESKKESKIESKTEEYEAVFTPNWEQLAKLVETAKGPDRTMAQFAKDCGKSPATFSRIMHGRNEKSLSEQLIRDIADNAYDPDMVSFDALMRANGMLPKKDKLPDHNVRFYLGEKFAEQSLIKKQIKSLIADELDARGVMSCFARTFLIFSNIPRSKYGISCRSSFSAKIQIDDKNWYWNFIVIFHDMKREVLTECEKQNVGRYLKPVFTYCSSIFLRDEWEPETFKNLKNSLVFIDPIYFEFVVNNLPDIRVNSNISLILVDLEKNLVVEEVMFPRKVAQDNNSKDQEKYSSVFDLVIKSNPSESEDEDFEPYSDEEDD